MRDRLTNGWRQLFRRASRPRDVDAELEFHLEMQTRRFEASGLDRATARARARDRLGDVQQARDACHEIASRTETDMERSGWWHGVAQDVSYGWRLLRRTPTFTITALVTLAIGLGANTAIFSVVNAVLIRTVPYPPADRLALIWNSYGSSLQHASVAAPEFADYLAQQRAFDGLAALRPQPASLTGGCGNEADCEPERVSAYVVSPNLFDLLSVAPATGRSFTSADGATGAPSVVLLSDTLWRRRFGADAAIVGKTIVLAAIPRMVIGVMPAGVRFPDAPLEYLKTPADVWIPFSYEQNPGNERGSQNLAVLARLRTDTSFARAQADLDAIAETFKQRFPARYAGAARHWRIELISVRDQIAGNTRPALLVLLGAVGVVLLIACANVANLMLARGSARRRELAVRNALGAGRARLVRQLLIESLVLVTGGGLLGVLLAIAGVNALVALNPGNIPLLEHTSVDVAVLVFSIALTVATGLLIGLVPAMRQSRVDPQVTLADAGRGVGASHPRQRFRRALVVAEVTLAVVVLVASGLLLRSFLAMTRVPLGFDASGTVVAQIALPRASYDTPEKITGFNRTLVDQLLARPGVIAASGVYPLPSSGDGWSGSIFIEGQPVPSGQPEPHAAMAVALPNYFSTMRIPIVDGRDFAATDAAGAPRVAIIDDLLARRHWPGQSAVGKRLNPFDQPKTSDGWMTVVGVVSHVHAAGPRNDSEPLVYLPELQQAESSIFFVARRTGDLTSLPSDMRASVRAVDPALAISRLASLDDLNAKTTAPDRFNVLLLTIFAIVALAIAAVGLYGVMAYLVSQRQREIGIRLALGGRPGTVLASVVAEGLTMTVVGLVLGLVAAVMLSRLLADMVFEIRPTDPLTYAAIAALLLVVALLASFVPARRAMRVDPVTVLRE